LFLDFIQNFSSFCSDFFDFVGLIASCHAMMDEAISLAKELNDMNALAQTLSCAAGVAYFERDPTQVDRFASEMIELSTRHNFVFWLAIGAIYYNRTQRRLRSFSFA
jgi:hypothetical protein